MRTLFLDFDGVLHALVGPAGDMRTFCWAPHLVGLLEGHADVQIVVHASARDYQQLDYLQRRLGPLGSRVVALAPLRMSRWQAIQEVVAERGLTNYLILDDMFSEFPQGLRELVLCNPREGVRAPDVQERIRQWLIMPADSLQAGLAKA